VSLDDSDTIGEKTTTSISEEKQLSEQLEKELRILGFYFDFNPQAQLCV
jgi:hypothetical protein